MTVMLQPIQDNDEPFLFTLYATTRAEELAWTDWPPEQRDAFLRSQFYAQRTHYARECPGASFDLIVLDGERVGRLYVDRRADDIRIIDIALLPSYRNRGIGSHIMEDLLAEGASSGRPVSIHVEKNNPAAMRFYEKLGFICAGDIGTHLFMECRS